MSDKTYSETQGVPAFDWRQALEHPELYEHHELSVLSAQWVTCACGNQCAIIPRNDVKGDGVDGMPLDALLQDLGGQFHACIQFKEWDTAKEVLAKIEARSAILIAEELAKRNAPTYAESAQEQSE